MAISQGIGLPVGICANDISANAAIVNLATEQLMLDPMTPDEGWWGGWIRMLFNVVAVQHAAYIVTPANIARVILLSVCQKPIPIRNGFYEDLQFSIGPQPRPCQSNSCVPHTMQAFERDSTVTLTDFASSPQLLRVFTTDPADLGRRIVFQGPDKNGATVLDVDPQTQAAIAGETVFITLPFATTKNQFSGLTGILKDPTLGFVQVFMVDPATGTQTLLTTMGPNETTAQYRRYLLNGLPANCCSTMQVTADCRFDYVPVVSPSDYLSIPNIPALYEQVQAIRYSRLDTPAAAANETKHHAKALALLNGQLDLYQGKTQVSVRMPIFGSDRLRRQPV
jgi:hypothetical protein